MRPELANSPCSRLLKQKSSAHLPNLSREARLWTTVVDELPSGALERRRVQQRCPRAFAPLPSGAVPRTVQRAPTQEPAISKAKSGSETCVLSSPCPGLPVPGLSWFQVAGFSGPAPSGSCLFLFRLMFLSTGRGRHVPAPSGRDVGSSAGAPTQEPAFSGIPLHLVLFNLVFAYSAASVLIGEVSEAAVYECGRGGERSR